MKRPVVSSDGNQGYIHLSKIQTFLYSHKWALKIVPRRWGLMNNWVTDISTTENIKWSRQRGKICICPKDYTQKTTNWSWKTSMIKHRLILPLPTDTAFYCPQAHPGPGSQGDSAHCPRTRGHWPTWRHFWLSLFGGRVALLALVNGDQGGPYNWEQSGPKCQQSCDPETLVWPKASIF